MHKGFTLVELSIVLVIIGLLIGGILVAQSMVSTAKTQSVVRQLQQLDIAIANFQTKFNAFPGDTTKMPGVGRGSNDNGLIDNSGETPFVWHDLSLGVGLKNKFANNYPLMPGVNIADVAGFPEGTYTPAFDVKRSTAYTPLLRLGGGIAASFWDGTRNYYQYMMPGDPANAGWQSADVMTPTDTLAIDLKLDDGLPESGSFFAREYQTVTVQNRCVSASKYNVNQPGFYCSWELLVGVSNGITQRR